MGLGKTVQDGLISTDGQGALWRARPCAHSSTLSTLAHWQQEFEHWSALDVMVYHGSQANRLGSASNLDLMARKTAAKRNPKVAAGGQKRLQ